MEKKKHNSIHSPRKIDYVQFFQSLSYRLALQLEQKFIFVYLL